MTLEEKLKKEREIIEQELSKLTDGQYIELFELTGEGIADYKKRTLPKFKKEPDFQNIKKNTEELESIWTKIFDLATKHLLT